MPLYRNANYSRNDSSTTILIIISVIFQLKKKSRLFFIIKCGNGLNLWNLVWKKVLLCFNCCISLCFYQQNYQKDGFPLTDLQKFLREQKDFPVVEEGSQTDVHVRRSVFCCCQRYDGVYTRAVML